MNNFIIQQQKITWMFSYKFSQYVHLAKIFQVFSFHLSSESAFFAMEKNNIYFYECKNGIKIVWILYLFILCGAFECINRDAFKHCLWYIYHIGLEAQSLYIYRIHLVKKACNFCFFFILWFFFFVWVLKVTKK